MKSLYLSSQDAARNWVAARFLALIRIRYDTVRNIRLRLLILRQGPVKHEPVRQKILRQPCSSAPLPIHYFLLRVPMTFRHPAPYSQYQMQIQALE